MLILYGISIEGKPPIVKICPCSYKLTNTSPATC